MNEKVKELEKKAMERSAMKQKKMEELKRLQEEKERVKEEQQAMKKAKEEERKRRNVSFYVLLEMKFLKSPLDKLTHSKVESHQLV